MPPKRSSSKPKVATATPSLSVRPAGVPLKPTVREARRTCNAPEEERTDGLVDSPRQAPAEPEAHHVSSSSDDYHRQLGGPTGSKSAAEPRAESPDSTRPAASGKHAGGDGSEYADDLALDDAVVRRYIDPDWDVKDLADMDTDTIATADVADEIRKYEAEVRSWRTARTAGRDAAHGSRRIGAAARSVDTDVPDAAESTATARESEYARRTSVHNPSGVCTLDTVVANTLAPEVIGLGGDAVAEALVQVKTARLDAVAMDRSDVLECLSDVTHLYLSDNRLTELSGLELLEKLQVLVVNGNRVKSLLPVGGLELELLDARDNAIESLYDGGCCVVPLTVRRLFLEGNPCVPDMIDNPAGYERFVALIRENCPRLVQLDDHYFEPADSDDDNDERPSDAEAADEDDPSRVRRSHVAADEEGMDFDVEEEEARMAANASNSSEVPKVRLAMPVAGGGTSQVRTMTDDLLQRYRSELAQKVQAIDRADRAANLGGRVELRQQLLQERESAVASAHPSRPGSAGGRPGTGRGRPDGATTLADALGWRSSIDDVLSHRPQSASGGAHITRTRDEPPASSLVASAGEPTMVEKRSGDEQVSGSDDSSEDEAYTGVRPHAETVNRQQDLQRELRFTLNHQRNVGATRLDDLWGSGADRLRDMRVARMERQPQAESQSKGYALALQKIRDYTGKTDLEKYKHVQPPQHPGTGASPSKP
jgi:hypothetical protein